MTTQCEVFIATSLDGFIARKDGSIDWLNQANQVVPPGEDCGYGKFMADVDVLVMGRNTFEQVLTFTPWPYGSTPVIVMSRNGVALPPTVPSSVSVSTEAPAALIERLGKQGVKKVYLDGGQTIQSFLATGLVNSITITTIPVLLGEGKPLFGPLPKDVKLLHKSTKAFEFGFVQSQYELIWN
ncbi:dihydrofolate reductase family protein [Limnobacter parvus]|uniref:Dihydrofolate reductase family protein n=1 Tax=Limnobacter parvus TaxID=2939690 RepID=A0ABT1XJI8_9BURK|nr:dihydrofolate reductase family protein [Limnobacter parvus]MCR2747440.1 dihydrofolate reductase family protein [Limnobacter parvus]